MQKSLFSENSIQILEMLNRPIQNINSLMDEFYLN